MHIGVEVLITATGVAPDLRGTVTRCVPRYILELDRRIRPLWRLPPTDCRDIYSTEQVVILPVVCDAVQGRVQNRINRSIVDRHRRPLPLHRRRQRLRAFGQLIRRQVNGEDRLAICSDRRRSA